MTYLHPRAWPSERHDRLLLLVDAGLTAREIGLQLGLTRNAILGYAHRKGIILPMTPEKRAACRVAPKRVDASHPRKGSKFPPGHPAFRSRPFGARAFSDDQIAVAIAARLAGASRPKASALIGAKQQIMCKWERIPELAAMGRELFERAKADAAVRLATRLQEEAAADLAERQRIDAVNAPVLAMIKGRDRDICERLIAGETLQAIGDRYGVSRERIRQIECRWRVRGLEVPGKRELSEAALETLKSGPIRPQGRPRKAIDFWSEAHKVKAPKKPRRAIRLSDAERTRRAQWIRSVAHKRWEGRATAAAK